jgi:hypothetical protein
MTGHPTRIPTGLGRLATAVVLILLLVGSALLMHTLAGHTGTHTATTTASHEHDAATAHDTTATTTAFSAAPAGTGDVTVAGADDCGGLCAMLCAIMGMACLMVLIVSTWALLRRRGARALFILSKTLGAMPALPTITVLRPAPNLAQLSILLV